MPWSVTVVTGVIYFVFAQNEEPEIKAKPAPKFTSVFQPKLDHKATRVQPFSFEGKDEEAKKRMDDLRKKLSEEERKVV